MVQPWGEHYRQKRETTNLYLSRTVFGGKDDAWPAWCLKTESLLSLVIPREELDEAARMESPLLLSFDFMAADTAHNSRKYTLFSWIVVKVKRLLSSEVVKQETATWRGTV